MRGKNVFVTVGTTEFDKLIQTITCPEVLHKLSKLNYDTVTLQIGNGKFIPQSDIIRLNYYHLKPNIAEDINNADLVISHCGAGSCLEVLGANKPLIAVINEDLMDNHQLELAKKLYENGHIFYCTCKDLGQTLIDMDVRKLKQYPKGNTKLFTNYLDKIFGYN